MQRFWKLLPVVLFISLTTTLYFGLQHDPKFIPSVMVGKTVPRFALPAIDNFNTPGLADTDLKKGLVSVVNIWASWCVPCREEHPLLMALSLNKSIRIVGINNKNAPEDARAFLSTYGNPFAAIGSDLNGRTTIDWGTYGVPETFIVDGSGMIRFKIIGGLGASIADGSLVKEIQKATLPLK